MATYQAALFLLAVNLGLLWLMMAAPLGVRTIRVTRIVKAGAETVWNSIRPTADLSAWHPSVIGVTPVEGVPGRLEFSYRHPDRHGNPTRRIVAVDRTAMTAGSHFSCDLRIVEDSALDRSFWDGYSERRIVERDGARSRVTFEMTDDYRGLAAYLFRLHLIRREITALKDHLEQRPASRATHLEHPLWQTVIIVLSTLLLWPFFGLNKAGLMISTFLTLVIILHELGHMIAYRTFGHPSARMIFVPLLGGIAIGGRPYHSRFEVATCALMGAGISALLVPILIAAHQSVTSVADTHDFNGPILVFMIILGAFNLLNLLPTYRFDGGQVLRQVFESGTLLAVATFGVTGAILWTGWRIGLSPVMLMGGLAVFTLLSLIKTKTVKPSAELIPMSPAERLMTGFGYYAALSMHAYALIYACQNL
ncbi:SRPBCC family protein [Peteryoungia ipomoeae]|uniref:Zn-dependent protease n=1 Tax=Peteryoungia ipomoeae TaxID=1210932 RepID=A0A4S8P8A6_9HYPH|nr:SRPBCC family protein [Peteryoungia ipomoeae]THV25072.1 hypothetical protein FAA97_02375 [Peteryoungia ipomoeae]